MKKNKILSLVLAVVVLITCTSILTFAAPVDTFTVAQSFTSSVAISIDRKFQLDKAKFNYDIVVDEALFTALDGESTKYKPEIESIVADVTDSSDGNKTYSYSYFENKDEFFKFFESKLFHKSGVSTILKITTRFDFASTKVFGDLNYKISLFGFSGPGLPTSIGPIEMPDDANVMVSKDVFANGTVNEFPHVTAVSVVTAPKRQEFNDAEKFDLTDVAVTVTTDSFSGLVTYSSENAKLFTCIPDKNANLTVDTKEVYTYFDGFQVGVPTAVKVSHAMSTEFVCITNNKWTEPNRIIDPDNNPETDPQLQDHDGDPNTPPIMVDPDNNPDTDPRPAYTPDYGYHAHVCAGCGKTHDAQPHRVDPNVEWVSDNNATFVENGTEHNFCVDCGAKLTRDSFHSAGYEDSFAELHFLNVIFDYINGLFRIIRSAIGKF